MAVAEHSEQTVARMVDFEQGIDAPSIFVQVHNAPCLLCVLAKGAKRAAAPRQPLLFVTAQAMELVLEIQLALEKMVMAPVYSRLAKRLEGYSRVSVPFW